MDIFKVSFIPRHQLYEPLSSEYYRYRVAAEKVIDTYNRNKERYYTATLTTIKVK